MGKPVFRWWAHKMLWDALAEYDGGRYPSKTGVVMDIIKDAGIKFPKNGCFACQCVVDYLAGPDEYVRIGVRESCQYCPLDWKTASGTCYRKDSPYEMWIKYRNGWEFKKAAEYAAKIRDLGLKENAHELYDVKEHEDE